MSYKIQQIEGIGPAYAKKLEVSNIATTEDLLRYCCDAKGRKQVAAKTGIDASVLLKWTNMADLMRITGIAGQFAELLKASGVDTIKELRNRNPENLAEKMAQVNAKKKLTRAVPPAKTVAKWIAEAKTLQPVISH